MRFAISTILLGFSLFLPAMDRISDRWQQGMTVSCQGYGREWGTDLFAEELDRLAAMGVNSITIHPYARINEDGSVTWRQWPKDKPPIYFTRPIREAHTRGLSIMIKPHLAYWGSSFSWRGDIKFEDPAARQRFFDTYRTWIVEMARISADADIFVVGAELKHFIGYDQWWKEVIADVRRVSKSKLTYAANWDSYNKIKFWKDLDYIGVQGYFPITAQPAPDRAALENGWKPVIAQLKGLYREYKKPVLFTEFGYNRSMRTAKEPWAYDQDHAEEAEQLQALCLEVGLEILAKEKSWFHGAWLWKWFAGPAPWANFRLDTPRLRKVIRSAWK